MEENKLKLWEDRIKSFYRFVRNGASQKKEVLFILSSVAPPTVVFVQGRKPAVALYGDRTSTNLDYITSDVAELLTYHQEAVACRA